MNLLDLYNDVSLIKAGQEPVAWADIDMEDSSNLKVLKAINLSLQDLWLNNGWLFRNRTTTMTTVASQFEYDIPFDGELLQDGLLYQPPQTGNIAPAKVVLKYLNDKEFFFQQSQEGQPRFFTVWNDQLLIYPIPDKAYVLTCMYNAMKWALSNTTVDTISNSGQNILSVASTEEFSVGDIVFINPNTATVETGVVQSIQAGVSLTFVGNLTFAHQVGESVKTEKKYMSFQNDTPNFPDEYHNILVYAALRRLFVYDGVQYQIYTDLLGTALNNMISNSKNAQSAGPRLMFARTNW